MNAKSKKHTREDILLAARRSFARLGYHGASIKAIAAEADIRSPSILHYHFKSKEEIFLAVIRAALSELTEKATQVGLAMTQGPRALEAVDAFLNLLEQEQDLPPLFLECLAMAARGQGVRDELSRVLQSLELMVTDAIRQLLGVHAEDLPLSTAEISAVIIDLMTGHGIRTVVLSDTQGPSRRQGIRKLLSLLRPLSKQQLDSPSQLGSGVQASTRKEAS